MKSLSFLALRFPFILKKRTRQKYRNIYLKLNGAKSMLKSLFRTPSLFLRFRQRVLSKSLSTRVKNQPIRQKSEFSSKWSPNQWNKSSDAISQCKFLFHVRNKTRCFTPTINQVSESALIIDRFTMTTTITRLSESALIIDRFTCYTHSREVVFV